MGSAVLSRRVVVLVLLVLLGAIGVFSLVPRASRGAASSDVRSRFFRRLEEARIERKAEIVAYFAAARHLAEEITHDDVMMTAFLTLREPGGRTDPQYEFQLDVRYVERYGDFYDVLMVDRSGFVFHSMRQESDFHSNLLEGPLGHTKLAKQLRQARDLAFVDYEFYPPSDEPAAFFVVPLREPSSVGPGDPGSNLAGWFVLQCPLNKLNSILADRRGLGRTGEVYLVNAEDRMVTQSRFRPDPPNLQLKVNTQAVAAALADGRGERIVEDYRGVAVLSSFERFELFGTTWVILAEMDEAEVITEHYRQSKRDFIQALSAGPARGRPAKPGDDEHVDPLEVPALGFDVTPGARVKRVDTNEFAKASPGTVLQTHGVSTCTAVTVLLPGRFAYLAHIGPSDRIYGKPDVGHNDGLGDLLRRLRRYDVYPCELPELRFTVVAVHRASFERVVDRLLDLGIELTQIRLAYNPTALCAGVVADPMDSSVQIEWTLPTGATTTIRSDAYDDLATIVKRIADGV